jgi:RimJ/RimL family protein N-acetyltransferase
MDNWPRGRLVRLRPPEPADQPVIDTWSAAGNRSGWNTHARAPRTIAERLAEGPLIGEHGGIALIVRLADDQPIGDIAWKPVRYGPRSDLRSRAWRLGRELAPHARGQGYGTEALRLLIGWLFEHTEVNRLDGFTDVHNLPSQRSVEKAGLLREGVLRGAVHRGGQWHDVIMYAITRDDWLAQTAGAAAGTAARRGDAP